MFDNEKTIDNINLELASQYIELAYDKTKTQLAIDINNNEEQKKKLLENNTTLYSKYSEYKNNRKYLIENIKVFLKNHNESNIKHYSKDTSYKLLMDYYGYYITLLDIMSYNNREISYNTKIEIQNIQIKELTKQVKLRDNTLSKLNDEFRKKNIYKSLYSNNHIREYNDFSKQPLKLPYIQSNANNLKLEINNNDNKYNINSKGVAEPKNTITPSSASILKKKHLTKSPVVHRSFNYELNYKQKLKKINYPLKLNSSKFSMNLNDKILKSKLNNSNYFNKSNISINSNNNLNKSVVNSTNNKSNCNNTDVSVTSSWRALNSSLNNNSNIFNKQRQKYTKTLLRRNLVGRYEGGSPYLS